jgi:hypothetical protein
VNTENLTRTAHAAPLVAHFAAQCTQAALHYALAAAVDLELAGQGLAPDRESARIITRARARLDQSLALLERAARLL